MSDVANEVVATNTIISALIQKLYKPVYLWAKDIFATKQDLAAATGTSQASEETCDALLDELT